MNTYYDPENDRLVYTGIASSAGYWDRHWETKDIRKYITKNKNRFIVRTTRKYLSPGARVLEGGCGRGDKVYALSVNGYDAYGVDYAAKTVKIINTAFPELKIFLGDVRDLPFEDGFFDGYWSLGVIEHFYEGYEKVALEMKRVLKPGGFLFLTFPYLSLFRKNNIQKGRYKKWDSSKNRQEAFYQFALSSDRVFRDFKALGFEKVSKKPIGGLKGLKDETESRIAKAIVKRIFNATSLSCRILSIMLDNIFSPFTGHVELMILRFFK